MYTYMQNENGDYVILDPYHKTVEPHKICEYLTAQVEMAARTQDLFGSAVEDTCLHVYSTSGFKVGKQIALGDEQYRITNVLENKNELWIRHLEPAAVEPWDGLFASAFSVYDINQKPMDMFVESIKGLPLDIKAVGLNSHTLIDAVLRGYLEWDRLFVGSASVWFLAPDGSATTVEEVRRGNKLELREVGLDSGTLVDAADKGYAAEWDGYLSPPRPINKWRRE